MKLTDFIRRLETLAPEITPCIRIGEHLMPVEGFIFHDNRRVELLASANLQEATPADTCPTCGGAVVMVNVPEDPAQSLLDLSQQ